ncbi:MULTISPECIES: MauE/DoxX family redox-associated membrane protein [Nocardioides]|uniref:MauE/DoxX family redox-associated membrane protein n=1 Tax=Nocardioides vastitatis TaxID=2568655 RepID=A0ABW0ZGQ7_9ACTN|nr:MauE/DoxX family redox-associated membrane protein [Nocardioides sp.]THJ05337.1 DoxX family membrane protein [Nocardioides sp.]
MNGALAWVGLLARLVTGGVWILAGGLKITEPQASIAAVRAYELLPSSAAEVVGLALPAIEVVVGLALVVGVFTRAAATVSVLLFSAFIVGIASVWARGIEIDCGCFGGGGAEAGASSDYPWEIARDAALLAASLLVVLVRRTRFALDSVLFDHRPGDRVGAAVGPEEGEN